LIATLIGGYPIFKEAFENILERRMTMELSMTIALVSALAIGEFFTALVITAFVLAAEIIVDTVGIGLAAAGILNPLLATFIHVTSELIFILNSTRLLPTREKVKTKSKVRRVKLVKSPIGWV
jgi:cation transport ATPase